MKKYLYSFAAFSAVALVAASASAAEPLKVSVGGFANFYGGYTSDLTLADVNRADFIFDGEIQFKAEAALDNGMKVGARIELEGNSQNGNVNGAGDQIDHAYGYVEGRYGRVIVGSLDGAPYQVHKSAPDVGVFGVDDSDLGYVLPSFNDSPLAYGTILNLAGDSIKGTYFTPVMGGLRVGLSYIPEVNGLNSADKSFTKARNGVWKDGYEAVVAYDTTGDGSAFHVDLGAGLYDRADAGKDMDEDYSVGLSFSTGPWTVGAGARYAHLDDELEHWGWNAGVAWEQGRWGASLSFMAVSGETNILNAERIEDYLTMASGKYNLAAGVDAFATIGYIRYDNVHDDDKRDVYTAVTGLALSF